MSRLCVLIFKKRFFTTVLKIVCRFRRQHDIDQLSTKRQTLDRQRNSLDEVYADLQQTSPNP